MALPKDYSPPVTGNYMKFVDGENRFRILSDIIVGMEFWKTEENEKGEKIRKPVRRRTGELVYSDELGLDKWGNPERPKFFWAMVVWNYQDKMIQVLEITQRRVQRAIEALERNIKKWGDAKNYDICVTRSGQGTDTDYMVQAEPPIGGVAVEIKKAFDAVTINLEALYEGSDPFVQVEKKIEEPLKKDSNRVVTAADGDDGAMDDLAEKSKSREEEIDIKDIPF